MEPFLTRRYDAMWEKSTPLLRTGALEIDPVLAAGRPDRRRGMTVVLRPTEEVRTLVGTFLDELRQIEPGQYIYQPEEFHVTFLSLFTATDAPAADLAREAQFLEAVDAVAPRVAPMRIEFRGVTLSPGAVLVQGFTNPIVLNKARDELRRELSIRDLRQSLGSRYRLETAHMTVLRFRQPLRDPPSFVDFLEQARRRNFGRSLLTTAEVTRNDWYMSGAGTAVRQRVTLGSA